jgi:hypothetical protein
MAVHELHKEEVYLAIANKSNNIVYLNVWKQIYSKGREEGSGSRTPGIEEMKANDNVIGAEDEEGGNDVSYEIVAKGFHSGGISCMDISI